LSKGRPTFAGRGGAAGGFTLLEIGIALVVLMLAFTLALPGLDAVTGAKMRSAAGHLSSSMRALYSEAALTGRTCRIAFDMDERSYSVQCAQGAVTISSQKEEVRDGRRYVDLKKQQEEADRLRELAKDNPVEAQLDAKVSYLEVPGAPKVTLPDGVSFDSIWVQHQAQKYTAGDAYVYFFPQGNTEHALITLKRGEDLITVESSSLTGRVQLIDGAVEAPKT
jgi:general secretion pathway protein H